MREILKETGVHEIEQKVITIDILDDAVSGLPSRISRGIFTTQEQLDKARDNWDHLERTYNLDGSLYCAIECLKLPPHVPVPVFFNEDLQYVNVLPEDKGNEEKALLKRFSKFLNDLA